MRSKLTIILILMGLVAPPTAQAAGGRFRLSDDVLPGGVFLEVQHRTRYEFLNDEFRAGRNGDTDVVAFRTLIHGGFELPLDLPFTLRIGVELQDSRAEQNADTALNTTIVNAAELLRAYVAADQLALLGGQLAARAGRITMDLGSRRFVARNRYRNTINGFTGLDLDWTRDEAGGLQIRGFWVLPVLREPRARKRLLDGDVVFDDESLDVQFWGLSLARNLPVLGHGEVFVFGIHERDGSDRPTRNRQLATPGFRLFRTPVSGHFDYTLETAFQAGTSRASTSSTKELDHFAHFHHFTLGYTLDAPWTPNLSLQYDFASGDNNPADGTNERFDTLFGARRFDFGPTGIYGAFARSNLHSPGLRIKLKPHPRVTSFLAYRAFWLASDRDAWTTSGIQDVSGQSDSFVGSQFEIRLRLQVVPGNVMLESGYAHLFAGDFIEEAPNSNRPGDSDYVYTQVTVSF